MNAAQQKPPVISGTQLPQKRRILRIFIFCFCAGAVWFVVARGCNRPATADVQRLLADAKLAPLPLSATNVAYHQWGRLFSHETFARFQLSPADLNAFISNSPGLRSLKPKIYNSDYHHLPFPASSTGSDLMEHDYFWKRPNSPPWFDMSVHGTGRKYVLDWGPGMWVVIDEDKKTIWLNVGN